MSNYLLDISNKTTGFSSKLNFSNLMLPCEIFTRKYCFANFQFHKWK